MFWFMGYGVLRSRDGVKLRGMDMWVWLVDCLMKRVASISTRRLGRNEYISYLIARL